MYNLSVINRLIEVVKKQDGIGDKEKLAEIVQKEFALEKERKVYVNGNFAIRFSKSASKRMGNTVLSLSALQKYDDNPFFVCIVTPTENYLLLANTTFLKKISHSSQELRIDNIKGSFNGSDIMLEFRGMENEPKNFPELFAFHEGLSFEDNLERLVESSNDIVGRVKKFEVTPEARNNILETVSRTIEFMQSKEYEDLKKELDSSVKKVQSEIAMAASIQNVNLRGRTIEYLITDQGSSMKDKIVQALRNKTPLPLFKTEDKLGDYSKEYPNYHVEIDIKTKVLYYGGNPKAYNVDKLLEFLATEKSVYMIYLLGIDKQGELTTKLCSILDIRLLQNTHIIHHWAGRNSRGVAQFIENGLMQVLREDNKAQIVETLAREYLEKLMNL